MDTTFHFYLDEAAMCRRIIVSKVGVPIGVMFALLAINGCSATDALTAPRPQASKDLRVRVTKAAGAAALPAFLAALKQTGSPPDFASVQMTIDGQERTLTPNQAIAALQTNPSGGQVAAGNLVRADLADDGTDVPNVGIKIYTLSLGGAYDGSTGHLNAFLAADPSSGGGNHVELTVTYSTMDAKARTIIPNQLLSQDVDGTTATINADVPMGVCDVMVAGGLYQFLDGGTGKWFTKTRSGQSAKVPGCTVNPCLPDESRLVGGATLIHAAFLIPSSTSTSIAQQSIDQTDHAPSVAADQEVSCSEGGSGTGGGGGGGSDDGDGGWIITYCIHTDYYAADGTYLFTTDDGCFEEEA
jgi:hypothetical protein